MIASLRGIGEYRELLSWVLSYILILCIPIAVSFLREILIQSSTESMTTGISSGGDRETSKAL